MEASSYLKLVKTCGLDNALIIMHQNSINEIRQNKRTDITINEWIKKYANNLNFTTNKHKISILHIANNLHNLNNMYLPHITKTNIENWIYALKNLKNSPKTIHNKHGLLSSCFKKAVADGLINKNPCEHIKLPRIPKTEMCILEKKTIYAL